MVAGASLSVSLSASVKKILREKEFIVQRYIKAPDLV